MVRTLHDDEVQVASTATPIRDCVATATAGLVLAVMAAVVAAMVHPTNPGAVVVSAALGALPATLSATAVVRRAPPRITPADRVTLTRAVLASGCAAIISMAWFGSTPHRSWGLFTLVVATLLLDLVDGWVARSTGTATADGALLDMQVDAGVLVILSIAVAPMVGAWVLLIGAMRYVYVALSWRWPVLNTSLPRSHFRRAVAGIQAGVLAAALAPVVPVDVATIALLVALVLLLTSFSGQIVAIQRRTRRPRPRGYVANPDHE
jgi:phosphatidylglycerophosphate synthase